LLWPRFLGQSVPRATRQINDTTRIDFLHILYPLLIPHSLQDSLRATGDMINGISYRFREIYNQCML